MQLLWDHCFFLPNGRLGEVTVGLITCGSEQQGHRGCPWLCTEERAGLAHFKPFGELMLSFPQEAWAWVMGLESQVMSREAAARKGGEKLDQGPHCMLL